MGGTRRYSDRTYQQSVQLAGDVALQAAQDLFFAETFLGAALDVTLGRGIGGHPDNSDHPQSTIGIAVAATIEAMPVLTSRGSVDRANPAQGCEGGF
jgi:hypothetical protein